jgi:hypothetical protein
VPPGLRFELQRFQSPSDATDKVARISSKRVRLLSSSVRQVAEKGQTTDTLRNERGQVIASSLFATG